jgi:hypothetical protein
MQSVKGGMIFCHMPVKPECVSLWRITPDCRTCLETSGRGKPLPTNSPFSGQGACARIQDLT